MSLLSRCYVAIHNDVIKWKYFPRYWSFVRGIHGSPVNSPDKCQWRGALKFSLICTGANGWVNNRDAGDLRCHRANHNVAVMLWTNFTNTVFMLFQWSIVSVFTHLPEMSLPLDLLHDIIQNFLPLTLIICIRLIFLTMSVYMGVSCLQLVVIVVSVDYPMSPVCWTFFVSTRSCPCPIHWSQVTSRMKI